MKKDSTGKGGIDSIMESILGKMPGGREYMAVRERVSEDIAWMAENELNHASVCTYRRLLNDAVDDALLGKLDSLAEMADGNVDSLMRGLRDKYAEKEGE